MKEINDYKTGNYIRTPRGTFSEVSLSKTEMILLGYGYHHETDDGKYLIMGNGKKAYAIENKEERK